MSFDAMHTVLADICNKYNVTIIDGRELVPNIAEFFCEDGTHPNELGFLQYGNNLYDRIKE